SERPTCITGGNQTAALLHLPGGDRRGGIPHRRSGRSLLDRALPDCRVDGGLGGHRCGGRRGPCPGLINLIGGGRPPCRRQGLGLTWRLAATREIVGDRLGRLRLLMLSERAEGTSEPCMGFRIARIRGDGLAVGAGGSARNLVGSGLGVIAGFLGPLELKLEL